MSAREYEYDSYARQVDDRDDRRERRRERSPDPRSLPTDVRDGRDARESRESFTRETLQVEPIVARPRSVPPPANDMLVPRGRSPSRTRSNYYRTDSRSSIASSSSERDRRRGAVVKRGHRRGDDYSRSRSRSRSRSSSGGRSNMDRAKSAVTNNFTNSTTGIGASLLGAVVGGFAARTATEAVSRHRDSKGGRRRGSDADAKEERIRLASTIIGAVAGGIGANALTNRFEDAREHRDRPKRLEPQRWDSRDSRDSRHWSDSDDDRYDSRRGLSRRDSSRTSTNRRAIPASYDDRDEYDDYDRDARRGGPRREASHEGSRYPY
jgi:outer membrane lipoprotein SlyB